MENIVINFEVDYSQLDTALEHLIKTGQIDQQVGNAFKQTNAEINKQAAAIKNVSTATAPIKKNLEDVSKATKNVSQEFIKGFQEGILDTLKEAGVSLEDFEQAMGDTGGKVSAGAKTVRAEFRELVETIARAKAEGLDYGESYDTLVQKAAKLKDAIGDVNQEISNVASDTSAFDGLLSAAQGIAGAFSVAQGAAALFGDESEELQEVLLRVNSAMAILQGLQAVGNTLQKQSAASILFTTTATKAQAAATTAATFIMKAFGVAAVQTSTAFKVLRTAIITTGIGALLVGLGFLIDKLISFTETTDDAAEAQKKLKEAIAESATAARDAGLAFIDNEEKLTVARAKAAGKSEQEIFDISQEFIRRRIRSNERLYDKLTGNTEEQFKVEQEIDSLRADLEANQFNRQAELAEKAKEASKKALADREKAEKEARDKRNIALNDELAALERQLLTVDKGSRPELDLLKSVIAKKAELELNQEKLTTNQILLIKEKSLNDQLTLTKEYSKKNTRVEFEDEISKNNAVLSQLETTNDKRLQLEIENISYAAAIEIEAAEGNAVKIEEIYARSDKAILETKKKFIEDAVEYEIALNEANKGSTTRALQRIVADEQAKKDIRIRAANELLAMDKADIEKRMDALNSEYSQRLISDEEYALKHAQLIDQKKAKEKKTEEDITNITIKENEKRRQITADTVKLTIETLQQAATFFDDLSQIQTNRENEKLELERRRILDQLEAGSITEKEAIARNKRLDAEERKIKNQQAQRDKQLALFKAVVNTALAVTNAITTGDPYTAALRAAIVAAIGSAEIAVIASRPIPRFAKGKKKGESYTGWGEIGETGPELMERDGHLFLAPKRTIVQIKSQDIIHNPRETKSIFERVTASKYFLENAVQSDTSTQTKEFLQKALQTNSTKFFEKVLSNSNSYTNSATHTVDTQVMKYKEPIMDLRRLEGLIEKQGAEFKKAISKLPVSNVTIDEDGFNKWVQAGIDKRNYMSKYYSSK